MMFVIHTGFVLPIPSMHLWFRWFGYINPVAYAFESLMINEVHTSPYRDDCGYIRY